ncbi:MAG: hypothetical protein IJF67_15905 [Clostridia bacterium]|nr:hypothetical protein [Clostridia bacterium]
MMQLKNDLERKLFAIGVEGLDDRYDPAVRMIWEYRGKHGYHSRLSDCMVHPVRGSFHYAQALLNRDGEGDRTRAHDLLYRVIPLQDINPARDTYGIWSYFLEEDLEEMDCPDWNWADFNAATMLRILDCHADKLSEDIRLRLKDSIGHACRAIIKRDVQPSYTNISIMGAYVTLFAGEMMGEESFFQYGKQRLQKLYDYNMSKGSFSEFNSPTYTFVCLQDLAHLIDDIRDGECRRLAEELSDLAWMTIALHYHTATGQLAGPHDRAYDILLSNATRLSIERALDYRVRLVTDYDAFNKQNFAGSQFTAPLRCPEKYLPYFTEDCEERVLDQTFAPGRLAYTYMCRSYTLGSLHRACTWNQHRIILGYFGTANAPIAINLKCLHDGWDYCSGLLSTVQDKNRVLSAMGFSTNGGDTHINLDMVKNATIRAKDFRIRWLFEGAVEHLDVAETDADSFLVEDRRSDLHVRISFPHMVFGDLPVRLTVTREEGKIGIDAVILESTEVREINFAALSHALIVTQMQITEGDCPLPEAVIREEHGLLTAEAGNLRMTFPVKPAATRDVYSDIHLWRNGDAYQPAL